jgi:hypothetical protein
VCISTYACRHVYRSIQPSLLASNLNTRHIFKAVKFYTLALCTEDRLQVASDIYELVEVICMSEVQRYEKA